MNNARIMRLFASASILLVVCGASAAEPATDDVISACRAALSSERGAIVIDAWSTKPLPQEYRRVAGVTLQDDVISGWTAHRNPNGTSTIVVHAFDPETREGHFVVLVRDKSLAFKEGIYAFEFGFSRRAENGVTGLFFCAKTGPSAEWVWTGSNWKVTK